ncbi:MAG: YHS domain-containing protein [Nitrospiraceae bacterium]
MYRLLIVVGLLVVLYLLLRRAIREIKGGNRTIPPLADGGRMVQDPVCKVFVPKSNAVTEEVGGQTYFFCSRTCAQAFQKQLAR